MVGSHNYWRLSYQNDIIEGRIERKRQEDDVIELDDEGVLQQVEGER